MFLFNFPTECHNSEYVCNAEGGGNRWQIDEGFLTDKETLPVTRLFIADVLLPNRKVRYRVGPLECIGSLETRDEGSKWPISCID